MSSRRLVTEPHDVESREGWLAFPQRFAVLAFIIVAGEKSFKFGSTFGFHCVVPKRDPRLRPILLKTLGPFWDPFMGHRLEEFFGCSFCRPATHLQRQQSC